MSADPLAVHAPGEADANLYAYVRGLILKAVDPQGLKDTGDPSPEELAAAPRTNALPERTRAKAAQAGMDPESSSHIFWFRDESGKLWVYDSGHEGSGDGSGGNCKSDVPGGCTGGGDLEEADVTDTIERTRGTLEGEGVGTPDGKADGTTDGKCADCKGSDLKQLIRSGLEALRATTVAATSSALKAIQRFKHAYKVFKKRRAAFRLTKRDAGIPKGARPIETRRTPLEGADGKKVLDHNGKPVMTREYIYRRDDGSKIVIQEHSYGHEKGNLGPHFNVRPYEKPRNGKVKGTKPHYDFEN